MFVTYLGSNNPLKGAKPDSRSRQINRVRDAAHFLRIQTSQVSGPASSSLRPQPANLSASLI